MNGAAGNAAAVSGFQNNPGYQFQLQQGENAVLANQARTGQLASGNTNLDLLNYGEGVANQNWNNYLSQLQPYLQSANTNAAGIAGVNTGLGNQLNQSFQGQGNAAYGADTSIGNANANAALAQSGVNANILGTLAGAGNMAANLFGFLSDERAKDDIEPVGELYDGQKVFRFRYKGDHRHQIGLMAQDVEKKEPDAVIDAPDGFKRVDYKRATDLAADLMKFAA